MEYGHLKVFEEIPGYQTVCNFRSGENVIPEHFRDTCDYLGPVPEWPPDYR